MIRSSRWVARSVALGGRLGTGGAKNLKEGNMTGILRSGGGGGGGRGTESSGLR